MGEQVSGIGDAFRPFGKEYDSHTPAASLGPQPEVCPKCRLPMLDGAEHHTCQPSRSELEAQIVTIRASLAAAQAVLREVEDAVVQCPLCGKLLKEGSIEHAADCRLDACLTKEMT